MRSDTRLLTGVALLLATSGCIGEADVTGPGDADRSVGAVEVAVSTSGPNPDPDGYVVSLDEERSVTVDVDQVVRFGSLPPASYEVELSEVATHCVVDGGPTRTLSVVAGETTIVSFAVTCS